MTRDYPRQEASRSGINAFTEEGTIQQNQREKLIK